MIKKVLLVTIVAVFTELSQANSHYQLPNGGEIKVVLIAGSNSYFNYRHQADVCHAYQLVKENGIPDENIIVMMYDDIAFDENNPEPGVIINRPGGPNVYEGIKKDYTKEDVNKKVIFDVLLGNKTAVSGVGSGRVLESGPNDHVFVNFVDHGGPGILCLPNEDIKASEIINVLERMAKEKRFDKMFLYVEACESGSIFDDLLPDDLNIFVMTAADPHESSYACFYDEKRQTYLGDVYSVMWMQNAETENLRKESVNHQFEKVRTETNTSHVEEYGDIDLGITKLSEVIGYKETSANKYNLKITDAVPARHVPVAILGKRIQAAKNTQEKMRLEKQLHDLLQARKESTQFFEQLIEQVVSSSNLDIHQNITLHRPALTKKNLPCYENSLTQLNKCFKISKSPFISTQLYQLINLCDLMPEVVVGKIASLCLGKPAHRQVL